MQEPLLLRVYIQTILDKEPYFYRAYKVDISDHGVNFTCPDTNCNYLFDFIDVVSITPDQQEENNENTKDDFMIDIEREIEEELEACRSCAYNDCGSCSCYEKKSICCPYADDEEEGD